MVRVHIPAALRAIAQGETILEVEGRTLGEIVSALETYAPGIESRLVKDGKLNPGLAVFADNVQIRPYLDSKISPDAEIFFSPAISGG
jgi:molybdopterin converting factor small subunit